MNTRLRRLRPTAGSALRLRSTVSKTLRCSLAVWAQGWWTAVCEYLMLYRTVTGYELDMPLKSPESFQAPSIRWRNQTQFLLDFLNWRLCTLLFEESPLRPANGFPISEASRFALGVRPRS